jgi:hypothetical protein
MAHEIMITPKRIVEKDSRIGQASKIIPKTVKMTSSNVSDHTIVTKVFPHVFILFIVAICM